jgi:hypothetical protein
MNDNDIIKNALIDWIESHSEKERSMPYILSAKGSFSLEEISKEIKDETEKGVEFVNNIVCLTVDLLARGKEQL